MSDKKYKQGKGKVGYGLVVAISILIIIGRAGNAEGALSCARITSLLMPCLGYLNGGGRLLRSGACCTGVWTVWKASPSAADRQEDCRCLKWRSRVYHVKATYANTLAKGCGLDLTKILPSVISSSIDCSKIR